VVEKLGDDALKDGQHLETCLLTEPSEEWRGSILELVTEIEAVRANELWQWQVDITLRGEADSGLQSLFYIGVLSAKPISMMILFLCKSGAILGYVATAQAYRHKGACEILVRNMLADSRKRGCQVITVNTRYKGPLYNLLEKYGFGNLAGNSPNMIIELVAGAMQNMFAKSSARPEKLMWKHFPLVDKLFCIQEGAFIRSTANRIFGPGTYEEGFVTDMKAITEGEASACVLESTEGFTVGHACLRLDESWAKKHSVRKSWILDFFVHPAFLEYLPSLLGGFELPGGKTLCFVDADSGYALSVLEGLGFEKEGHLKNQTERGAIAVMGFSGSNQGKGTA
jgi:hypothetical protein